MSGIVGSAGSKSGIISQTELDYEEGTWTGASNGSLSSASNWTGHYTKIGRIVRVQFYHAGTVSAASAGGHITGLPFASASSDSGGPGFGGMLDGSPTNSNTGGVYAASSAIFFSSTVTSDTHWIGSIIYETEL